MKVTAKPLRVENAVENQPPRSPKPHGISRNSSPGLLSKRLGEQSGDRNPWVKHFSCDGRTYKVFKRIRARQAPWQIDVIIRGKRIQRSLDTNNVDAAILRASATYIRPARAGSWEAVQNAKLRRSHPSLGQVFEAYRKISTGDIEVHTITQNLSAMRLVVRRGLGNESLADSQVEEKSTAVLTGQLVIDFESWMKEAAVVSGSDVESSKRTVAAYLRHARSLFKESNMAKYKRVGLELPDLQEFMNEKTAKAAKLRRIPADDTLMAKTFDAAQKLREADRTAYIAWLLALQSMRRGEIRWIRWNWVKQINGRWMVLVPKEVAKSGEDRVIPLDARVKEELDQFKLSRCVGLDPESEDFIIPSPRHGRGGPGAVDRGEKVFRRVDAWMRSLGWTTNHTMHEMRAFYLSMVRDLFGLDSAQAVAGHSDQRTTQGHYVGQKSVKGVTITLPLQIGPVGNQ